MVVVEGGKHFTSPTQSSHVVQGPRSSHLVRGFKLLSGRVVTWVGLWAHDWMVTESTYINSMVPEAVMLLDKL